MLLKSLGALTTPLRPEDIYHFRWIDHVRLSRDGERVAYQLVWADAESRTNRSRVVVRRILDPDPIEATAGPRRDHSPEWSPDGRRLAFVSRKGAADQVFVVDLPGSEPIQVSSVAEGASSPLWSPDGSHIAFLGTVLSEPEGVVDDPRPPESSESVRRSPVARVATRLDYKHDGRGYVDGRHSHLFVVSVDGGAATQLTNGPWDVSGFTWSSDGMRIAFIGNADADSDLSLESHLYWVDMSGSMEKITTGFDLAAPAWSPVGDQVAYVATNGGEAGLLERLWVVPATGGPARCLTTNLDMGVGDGLVTDMRAGHGVRICWSRDGDRVFFTASGPGSTGVYSVDLEGNVRAEVGGERRVFDFDVSGGVIAFCASETTDPGELHVLMQGAEARLTDLNPWLRDRYIAQPEEHSFTAEDGWVMQGWLLKPPGFDPNRAHPLVMEVHGGPHAEYGSAFFHELQILAGMGFLVFYMNPRGSDGYGEVFRRAVVRDWGGKDYLDLMTALDQLIERTGYIDTTRMGIGGGSYGGYMTNWVIGQTDRFAAAVAMRPLSNLVSEYAQHDIVLWGRLELGPPPWPDMDELWKRSPIRYVNNVKTPLLLTCGEMDLRCAISQSEEMFGALRLLGKTVELVRFPEETHDLSRIGRPDRRVERLRRIAGWYERFLGTQTSEKQEPPPRAEEAVAVAEAEPVVEPEPLAVAEAEPIVEPEPMPEPALAAEPAAEVASAPEEPAPEAPVMADAPAEAPAFEEPAADEVLTPVPEPAPEIAATAPPEPVAEPAEPAETVPPAPAAETMAIDTMAIENTQVVETLVVDSAAVAEALGTAHPPSAEATQTIPVQGSPAPASEAPAPEPAPAEQAPAIPEWGHAPAPAPATPAWQDPAAAAASAPQPTWDQPSAPQPAWGGQPAQQGSPSWDAAPAAEAEPSWDAPSPAAPVPPAPQPVAASQAPGTPAPTVPPAGIASTIIAWPQGAPGGEAGNGAQQDAGDEAATSIMPAWQPPQAAAAKETLALHSLSADQVAEEAPAKLTFETGPFAGRVVGIPQQSAMVGRAPSNDIVIGDPATSGRHCRIEVRQGAYWISDLGSTNGTLVNGEPIIDKQLEHQDVISIGQNTIRFLLRG